MTYVKKDILEPLMENVSIVTLSLINYAANAQAKMMEKLHNVANALRDTGSKMDDALIVKTKCPPNIVPSAVKVNV